MTGSTMTKIMGIKAVDAAKDGDNGRLVELLKQEDKLSEVVRDYLVDMVQGKIKRPAHRPPKKATQEKYLEIALHVRRLERAGLKQHAAVIDVSDKFSRSERTVRTALSKVDPAKVDKIITTKENLAKLFKRMTTPLFEMAPSIDRLCNPQDPFKEIRDAFDMTTTIGSSFGGVCNLKPSLLGVTSIENKITTGMENRFEIWESPFKRTARLARRFAQ